MFLSLGSDAVAHRPLCARLLLSCFAPASSEAHAHRNRSVAAMCTYGLDRLGVVRVERPPRRLLIASSCYPLAVSTRRCLLAWRALLWLVSSTADRWRWWMLLPVERRRRLRWQEHWAVLTGAGVPMLFGTSETLRVHLVESILVEL